MLRGHDGQSEIESGSVIHFRLNPDSSVIAFDHTLTDGKPNTGARNSLSMQPFEQTENLPVILLWNSNAIIGYCKQPFVVPPLG